jgi:golgi phosphoprotein 3
MLLYEELLLLALDNKKGQILFAASSALPFALAAAILAELYLQGRINIIDQKVLVVDQRSTGIPILDESLEIIVSLHKDKNMEYWIGNLTNRIEKLQEKMIENLVQLGILQKEEHKFIFIPYYRYPEYDSRPELDLRSKLNQVINENSTPQEHIYLLLVMIKACSLINAVFEPQNRKTAKNRLKELIDNKIIVSTISIFAADLYKSINNAVAASTAAATTIIACH